MKMPRFATAAALTGLALSSSAAPAATDADIEALDQKVRILERKLELQEEAAKSKSAEAPVVEAGKEGFLIRSADKSFQLKLKGYIHADGRFYLDEDAEKASDQFLIRRARPQFDGTVGKWSEFRIMPDFGDGKSQLVDAYVDLKASPALALRTGKFKQPFGLERLQSITDAAFVELAHPTSLAPNRDVGAQLGGQIQDGLFSYAAGVFNGVPDGASADSDTGDSKDYTGRLFAHPLRLLESARLPELGIGVAASIGDQEGTPSQPGLSSYKTMGQQTFFSYRTSTNATDAAAADGTRFRLSPQGYLYKGPLGLLAEYVISEQDIANAKTADTIANKAWQLAASWVFTGEDASFKGVKPARPFGTSGGLGALELVARYSSLDVDDAAFPAFADAKKSASQADTWSGGLNWYLNRNLRALLNYDYTTFEGGAKTGDRPDEQVIMSRLQMMF